MGLESYLGSDSTWLYLNVGWTRIRQIAPRPCMTHRESINRVIKSNSKVHLKALNLMKLVASYHACAKDIVRVFARSWVINESFQFLSAPTLDQRGNPRYSKFDDTSIDILHGASWASKHRSSQGHAPGHYKIDKNFKKTFNENCAKYFNSCWTDRIMAQIWQGRFSNWFVLAFWFALEWDLIGWLISSESIWKLIWETRREIAPD